MAALISIYCVCGFFIHRDYSHQARNLRKSQDLGVITGHTDVKRLLSMRLLSHSTLKLLGGVVILLSLAACNPIDQVQLQAVQTGVEATAKNFPILDGVDIIRNTSVTSTSLTGGSLTCYYGEATLVIGSQLSEAQILDRYASLLKPYGYYLWPPDDTTKLTRRFQRGFYESVVIDGIHDAFIGGNYGIDLEQIKKKYTSVMYISMVYSLPKFKGCY